MSYPVHELSEDFVGPPISHQARYYRNNQAKERERRKKYYHKNKEKCLRSAKHYKLQAAYGIGIDEYEAMLESQDGTCAICDGVNASGHALHVDHCHDSGRVRGLLCTGCNTLLGAAKDSAETLNRAIKYIA